ncbi:hypothetical protein [Salinimonas lutimaris]|uniref:hypothetical protein n=1 Tax=Salinimonas lutimaris TaxID=914153 RepID=UPI0010BF9BBC|nr:hypothetical protein [Salinimonas lutimaris]
MKLDITKELEPEFENTFTYKRETPFFMHLYPFKRFFRNKSKNKELTFECFLEYQALPGNVHSFITHEVDWLFHDELEALITTDGSCIEYSLVPFVIKEKQTNQEFRIGEKFLLTPNRKVYRLAY